MEKSGVIDTRPNWLRGQCLQLLANDFTHDRLTQSLVLAFQLCRQRIIDEGLVALPCFLGLLFEHLDDGVIEINCNAGFAFGGQYRTRRPLLKSYSFFIFTPFFAGGFAHRDQSNRVLSLGIHHHAQRPKNVHSHRHPPLFAL